MGIEPAHAGCWEILNLPSGHCTLLNQLFDRNIFDNSWIMKLAETVNVEVLRSLLYLLDFELHVMDLRILSP